MEDKNTFFESLLLDVDNVKNCPWCGNKPEFIVESCGSSREGLYWDLELRCNCCRNHGPNSHFSIAGRIARDSCVFILEGKDKLQQAVNAWNRRADDE